MKKTILIVALLTFGLTKLFSQQFHSITVEFTGMKSDKGDVFVGLYNTEENFLKKRFKETIVKVKNKKATCSFTVPLGEYAISAFQDKNNNKKLDTYFFKIPKEPYGISNNATGFMAPPKYQDAKFTVNNNKTLKITIK